MTVRQVSRKGLLAVVRTNLERLSLCFSELNYTGCEQKRLANIHSVNIGRRRVQLQAVSKAQT